MSMIGFYLTSFKDIDRVIDKDIDKDKDKDKHKDKEIERTNVDDENLFNQLSIYLPKRLPFRFSVIII